MARRIITPRLVVVGLASLVAARPMVAHADQGATVSAVVAATTINSRTETSVAGAIGYRMDRFFGIGVEVTSIPTVKPDADTFDASALGITTPATSTVAGTDGRAAVFTTNVRIEIPVTARVTPYVVGGGGVANVKETFTVTPGGAGSGIPVVIPPQVVTRSSTGLALTAGGGISVLMGAHLSLDLDLRYLRLIAEREQSVGRFGVGLRLRF